MFTHGGRRDTGIDAVQWCRQVAELGAGEILLTSMDRDGTGAGFDLDLLRAVCGAVRVPVIASGGVGTLAHFVEGAQAGATGLLAASVFHFGTFTIAEVKAALAAGRAAGAPAARRGAGGLRSSHGQTDEESRPEARRQEERRAARSWPKPTAGRRRRGRRRRRRRWRPAPPRRCWTGCGRW